MRYDPFRNLASRRLAVLLSITMSAGCMALDAEILHPTALIGRWVRLRSDGSWGDTLEYLSSGHVRGSVGHSVPASARWSVVRSRLGEGFCAIDVNERSCQPYRLEGDTLVLGGLTDPTYFRRVR